MDQELFPVDKPVETVNKSQKKPTLTEAQFEIFWKLYPRKTAKYLAKKIWLKVIAEEGLFQRIMDSLDIHKIGKSWNEKQGIYIPHAATWINQKRWEDHEPVKLSPENEKKLERRISELEAIKQREILKRFGGQQ